MQFCELIKLLGYEIHKTCIEDEVTQKKKKEDAHGKDERANTRYTKFKQGTR